MNISYKKEKDTGTNNQKQKKYDVPPLNDALFFCHISYYRPVYMKTTRLHTQPEFIVEGEYTHERE